ncbi:MAG: MFS transporter [Acidobacteria bacterium]|nr:MFS transporter [Acidobacteriota bacterium]
MDHSPAFRFRRLLNWFPLGMTYAALYMGRYNLTVAQGALGTLISKVSFGEIFALGAVVYGLAFVINGPLTDRWGGRRAMLVAAAGAADANLSMGFAVWHALLGGLGKQALLTTLAVLYGLNMYFQSFGAVAIVKVNAHWFHLQERGKFSGIFGIMIASGIFLAFDLNERLLRMLKGTGAGGIDPNWHVFIIPGCILAALCLFEFIFLRNQPSDAGLPDFDTGDASSGEDGPPPAPFQLMKRILTHPVLLTIALVEFCTGVLRNGVMHWFRIYAKEQLAVHSGNPRAWDFALSNWGLLLMVAGIIGGMSAGYVSDLFFQSRRAPAAFFLYSLLTACCGAMAFSLHSAWPLVVLVFLISVAVIGTHGLLSGTATMDFGGRRAAATAVGVIDGFVYLGTGLQSYALGWITTKDWGWWPLFLLPWGVLGTLLLTRIWHARPGKGGH